MKAITALLPNNFKNKSEFATICHASVQRICNRNVTTRCNNKQKLKLIYLLFFEIIKDSGGGARVVRGSEGRAVREKVHPWGQHLHTL
jgi:acyl-ACP thioesterase